MDTLVTYAGGVVAIRERSRPQNLPISARISDKSEGSMKQIKYYDVNYSDKSTPIEALEDYFSKSDIKRKIKEKSISIAENPIKKETWIKIGKTYIILNSIGGWTTEYLAELWWTYHFQVMPKILNFKNYESTR